MQMHQGVFTRPGPVCHAPDRRTVLAFAASAATRWLALPFLARSLVGCNE